MHRIPYKLQVSFGKRATNYKVLLREITYKDKASYTSLPPCSIQMCMFEYVCTAHYTWGAKKERKTKKQKVSAHQSLLEAYMPLRLFYRALLQKRPILSRSLHASCLKQGKTKMRSRNIVLFWESAQVSFHTNFRKETCKLGLGSPSFSPRNEIGSTDGLFCRIQSLL